MNIQARPLSESVNGPLSWFPVYTGLPCDLVLEIADNHSGRRVNWSGHKPRFRVYSQYVDRFVVVEITDPQRCRFEPDGIWKLHMTAEETAALPRGGLTYTLEHRDRDGNWQLAIRAGISCRQPETELANSGHNSGPHFNRRAR